MFKTEITDVESQQQYHSLMIPIVLTNEANYKPVNTYALLDNQSNTCFVKDDLVKRLQASQTPVQLNLTTISHKTVVYSNIGSGLKMSAYLSSRNC